MHRFDACHGFVTETFHDLMHSVLQLLLWGFQVIESRGISLYRVGG